MINVGAIDLTTSINYVANQVVYWIVSAIIILVMIVLGFFVAKIIISIFSTGLKKVKLEEWVQQHNLQHALAGFTLTQISTTFLKVYIVFAFLGAAAQLVGIPFFSDIISGLLRYLPSLLQALVLIVAILFAAAFVTNTIRKQTIFMAKQLALGIQILIAYIAIILALPLILPNLGAEIGVLQRLLELFISALILAIGLAFGLGFGLGIKDAVATAAQKNQEVFDNLLGKIPRSK